MKIFILKFFRFTICLLMSLLASFVSSAQVPRQTEMKANSEVYTGEFYITFLDGNSKFMVTKLRISPGSYNEWHIHPDAAQTMFVIDGQGYYQEEGKDLMLLKEGDMIITPPNIKHWNGSTPNDSVTIITITEVNENPHVKWLGKINPEIFVK